MTDKILELPKEGGNYIRDKDGKLIKIDKKPEPIQPVKKDKKS